MRIHLKTLGCRLNEAELESWSRGFRAQGHQITHDLSQADLVVVNTCAVTAEAVRKSRKLMHRAHRSNPRAKLVVSGCFASLDPRETARTLGVDLVVNNPEKDRLVEITTRELGLNAMPELATASGENTLLGAGRQRAFIKVQDGCRYRCTFCVVTLARGEERSRSIPEVIDEIDQLHGQGIQEVVLTGVHIGGYGSDCGSSLVQLVTAVLQETDIPRLRLGAVEPWDLPEAFWGLFDNPRFMPHLHLPLQSGADTVLRRMARRCKRGEFQTLAELARRTIPDFNITTDIIVGFPGESDKEWQQTLELVERIGFGHLHIFAYSARPGTRAAALPDPVPREVIRTRSRTLHSLGSRLKRQTLERFVGRSFQVLVEQCMEESDEEVAWNGYTPNFLRVAIQGSPSDGLGNQIRKVRLERANNSGDQLLGTVLQ
jgi:threonylcarbamoyladenosine tRNA methylthiotransferase MtaB